MSHSISPDDRSTLIVPPSRTRSTRSARRVVSLTVALAFAAAACGGGSDDVASDSIVAADEQASAQPDAAPAEDDAPVETAPRAPAEPPEAAEPDASGLRQNGEVTFTGDALPPYDGTITDDAVGTTAPVIEGQSFDGTPITIGGPTENPTMVVFLAHWCPHCNDEIPELTSLNDAGSIPEGLDIVGVSTAVDESRDNYPPSEWIAEKGWPWPTMADDTVLSAIEAMGGTSFPFTVILDADGTVLARKGGSATAEQTLDFINSALA